MSDTSFRTMHALRIKGFAKTDIVAELAGVEATRVEHELVALRQLGHAQFREARSLWQLTADGRIAHAQALTADVRPLDRAALKTAYQPFLILNDRFKLLCGDWEVRSGITNDHSDRAYDSAVVGRLVSLDAEAQDVITKFGRVWSRLGEYGPRLAETCQKVVEGETKMLTGVMCGSYHDVWMELHEDLILTLGIDRGEEGSS